MAGLKLHLLCLLFLVIAVTAVVGGGGGRSRGHHDRSGSSSSEENYSGGSSEEWGHGNHHGKHHRHHHGWWRSPRGIGAIIGIALGSIAILAIITCVVRKCCAKNRKDRVGDYKRSKLAGKNTFPPTWSSNLVFKPELAAGFGNLTDGFMRIGSSQIVRTRPGTQQTDGAKWAVGMTKGKHVFEVTWRWVDRGNTATIGLATQDAPLQEKGEVALVGGNPQSWGFDIVKRRTIHRNRQIETCPTDGSYVPDKFLMYVDMDDGTIGYGNDVTYWGEVIVGLPTQGEPLYLMVGATKCQSEISVNYLGSAPTEGEEEKSGMKPPHHLPPLFNVAPANPTPPPTYRETDEKNGPPTDFVEPTMMPVVPPKENESELPPPYNRPPLGAEKI